MARGINVLTLNHYNTEATVDNPVNDISHDSLPDNAEYLHTQPIREHSITVQVLDENTMRPIETIEGLALSGAIRVDGDSLIRRTGSLKMVVIDEVFPEEGSLIWFGNVVRIYIGIKDQANGEVTNFLLGTFWVDSSEYTTNEKSVNLNIHFSDKMTKYENVKLENPVMLEKGTPIGEAIQRVMERLGERNFGYIAESGEREVVPDKLDFNIGTNALDMIVQLRDMYMDYKCGYNIAGEFEFYKVENQKEFDLDEPKWRFDTEDTSMKTMVSFDEYYNFKEIVNRAVVYGATSERTGITPYAEAKVTNLDNPFNVRAIGERTEVIVNDKYSTTEQCLAEAKYTVWRGASFNEQAIIETLPIYILDVDDVIKIKHPHTGVEAYYLVDSFELNLAFDRLMSIRAHKVYYITVEYGEEKNSLVDAIIRGINEYGWLSLGEERIAECYGIAASGRGTLTVAFTDVIKGGEQAAIINYPTTKNQTLSIDLADWEGLDFNSPHGLVEGKSSADSMERVLAHEMFHAVWNDYFGYEVSIMTPILIQEGFAEFLHGIRGRFESSYSSLSQADKKKALCDRLDGLLNKGEPFNSSEDYVAAALLAMAIYRIMKRNDKWDTIFTNLKNKKNLDWQIS